MEIRAATRNSRTCITQITGVLRTERDIVDLIGLCGEQNADRLLVRTDNLPDEFFDLKSGLAGTMLQKFMTYHLTAAFVVPPTKLQGRFKELANESARNPHFHIFAEENEALNWLFEE